MSGRVVITGAAGRMGRRLMVLTSQEDGLDIVGAIAYPGHRLLGERVADIEPELPDLDVVLSGELDVDADVMIDFSLPEGTEKRITEAVDRGIAMVIGTTGLSREQQDMIYAASEVIPVIHALNYSAGVNYLMRVIADVAQALGKGFDIEIVESHHNNKIDSPSGTAIAIAEKICDATGRNIDNDLRHGRTGRSGVRSKEEIGVHALRMGSVVGDHSVYFGSDYEIIEISHRAQSRDQFAAGAVKAAKWLCGREAGMYTMEDVLYS